MPSFLLPSTLPAVYSSFSNEIYVHHSSLHPGTIWSAKCGSCWDARLSRVNVTMCLCHRKSVMQAMLSYFIFCHLIAGGLMGFFQPLQWFLWMKWTMIQMIQSALGEKKKDLWLCTCKGLCTSVGNIVKNCFCLKCCVHASMNEYIVKIISATRLWLVSRYSHHTLRKAPKTDIHVPSDFHHFVYKQTTSTWSNNHWLVRGKHNFIWII